METTTTRLHEREQEEEARTAANAAEDVSSVKVGMASAHMLPIPPPQPAREAQRAAAINQTHVPRSLSGTLQYRCCPVALLFPSSTTASFGHKHQSRALPRRPGSPAPSSPACWRCLAARRRRPPWCARRPSGDPPAGGGVCRRRAGLSRAGVKLRRHYCFMCWCEAGATLLFHVLVCAYPTFTSQPDLPPLLRYTRLPVARYPPPTYNHTHTLDSNDILARAGMLTTPRTPSTASCCPSSPLSRYVACSAFGGDWRCAPWTGHARRVPGAAARPVMSAICKFVDRVAQTLLLCRAWGAGRGVGAAARPCGPDWSLCTPRWLLTGRLAHRRGGSCSLVERGEGQGWQGRTCWQYVAVQHACVRVCM